MLESDAWRAMVDRGPQPSPRICDCRTAQRGECWRLVAALGLDAVRRASGRRGRSSTRAGEVDSGESSGAWQRGLRVAIAWTNASDAFDKLGLDLHQLLYGRAAAAQQDENERRPERQRADGGRVDDEQSDQA
jgi:hypothetical protein